jgi:SAM-dependent methyltransferase
VRQAGTGEAIIAEVERLVPCPASIIELSCGRGHLVKRLQRKGYDVVGTNYSVYEDADRSLPILPGIDITKGADFISRKFDCVILSETIQNIPDHYAVFQTMADLLKEGGFAIVTTPNILNIRSRLHFLLTGFFRVKWNFIGFDVPYEESFCYHNHPLHLPVDTYYALKAGLPVERISGINIKYRNIFFLSLLYIPIYIATWWNTTHREIFLARSGYGTSVHTWISNFHVLATERLLLVLKKKISGQQTRKTPQISWYRTKSEYSSCADIEPEQ